MIENYINPLAVSEMTYGEFKEIFKGNPIFGKLKISMKDAFKQLGGKTSKKATNEYKAKKEPSK